MKSLYLKIKTIISKFSAYFPMLAFIVIFSIYFEITYCFHEKGWELDLTLGGVKTFLLSEHQYFFLTCKIVAILGIVLAVILGFAGARHPGGKTKFPLTAMAVTVGAGSGLISVDTHSQYIKAFPTQEACIDCVYMFNNWNLFGATLISVDNMCHIFGIILVFIVGLSLICPMVKVIAFDELSRAKKLLKVIWKKKIKAWVCKASAFLTKIRVTP